jgi:hypothetical protein
MGENLIPERRVNKLGHVVTKHVKATRVDSSRNNLPMVLSLSGVRAVRINVMATRFYNRYAAGLGHSPQESDRFMVKIINGLREFSDLTLSRLDEVQPPVGGVIAGFLLAKHDEHTVNDFLAVLEVFKREQMPQTAMEQYLWSLRVCEELAPQGENGEYPEERGEQCVALVRVMRHMEQKQAHRLFLRGEDGMDYPFISDDKLRQLVIGAGPDREAVVQLILDRNILDSDHLVELVSGSHPSLVEGGL